MRSVFDALISLTLAVVRVLVFVLDVVVFELPQEVSKKSKESTMNNCFI